jgi:site-specific recombinase XerD
MGPVVLLDAAGRRRSAATMPGHRCGQAPRNKGRRYPADPPSVEEIVLVMRQAGDRAHGLRLRGLIVVMWRAGLRISEALALTESDLDDARGAILVRNGKGNKRREVHGPVGLGAAAPMARIPRPDPRRAAVLRHRRPHPRMAADSDERASAAAPPAAKAGVRCRFAPHQLRHAHAVEMAREGVPLNVIQRQLGHANLGITSVYLEGIDNAEIIDAVHARRAPMIPASSGLRL